jgi:hypothetical protein
VPASSASHPTLEQKQGRQSVVQNWAVQGDHSGSAAYRSRNRRDIKKAGEYPRRYCPQSNPVGLNPFNNFLAHKSFQSKITYSRPHRGIAVAKYLFTRGSLNHHHHHHHQRSLTHNDPRESVHLGRMDSGAIAPAGSASAPRIFHGLWNVRCGNSPYNKRNCVRILLFPYSSLTHPLL